VGSYREQGIVLRTTKLGETDRILNLYTQGRGLVRAVAKGVRRPGSRFGGRLESYSHVDLLLHEGRNLDVVQQAELIASHRRVREDFARSAAAAVLAEVVNHVATELQRDNRLFLLLRSGLQALEACPDDPGPFVDAFLLRVASAAGFPVTTRRCAVCARTGPHVFLSVTRGGSLCADCAPTGTKAVPADVVATVALLGSDEWRPLAHLADSDVRRTAGSYARAYAEHHLDYRSRAYDLVPRNAPPQVTDPRRSPAR
jgi:DNA repair protein RecO (recombination protein O)